MIWEPKRNRIPRGVLADSIGPKKPFVIMGMCQRGAHDSMKATAMGIFQAVYAVGMFLGPTVSGIISDRFGAIFTFNTVSILMVGSGLPGLTITGGKSR